MYMTGFVSKRNKAKQKTLAARVFFRVYWVSLGLSEFLKWPCLSWDEISMLYSEAVAVWAEAFLLLHPCGLEVGTCQLLCLVKGRTSLGKVLQLEYVKQLQFFAALKAVLGWDLGSGFCASGRCPIPPWWGTRLCPTVPNWVLCKACGFISHQFIHMDVFI